MNLRFPTMTFRVRPTMHTCVLCKTESATNKDYCYGCDAYVCEACDHHNPEEKHAPEDHKQEEHRR